MSYIVGSKVKEHNKKKGCNTAGDFVGALSDMLEGELGKACARAKANGRKTVRGTDVCICDKCEGNYVVGSKVKDFNKKKGCNTAGDFVATCGCLVGWHAEQACKRAIANGRKTVRGSDL